MNKSIQRVVFGVVVLASTTPAFAQISRLTSTLTSVQTGLQGIAAIVVTIAIMWAGFKMLFQHAKWAEVAHIMWGGVLIGGATGLASWLVA